MMESQEDRAQRRLEEALKFAQDVIDNPDHYPPDFIHIPLDPDLLHEVLTRERVRILRELRVRGPYESVTALARALDRDVSRVSRDLAYLEGLELVELERDGRAKTVRGRRRPILIV